MADQKPRVFIIDDEDRIRQLVADYLDDFDEFEIRVAATGEDALEELAREPADVCIVDMRLPGISGEEFILTAGTRGLSKRFLLHTGSMDFNLSKGMKDLGMTSEDVFLKPSDVDEILARVRAVTQGGESA